MPKLRFPEFNDEWEEKKFVNIAKFSKGKNISKKDISDDGIPCIRYGELYTTYAEKISEVVSKTNLNRDELVFSDENDIIIPTSGETAIDLATASCVLNSGIAIGGDTTIIKTGGNGLFFSYYLNSGKKKIASLAQGVSVVHLYSSHLKSLDLNIPKIEEQQKIASFLSQVDEKIEKLEKKQDLWETYKKGMMQQIFSQKLRFKDENGEDYPDWEEKRLNNISQEVKRTSKTGSEEVLTISAGKGFISQKERWNKVIAGNSLKKYVLLRKDEFSYNRGNSKRFPYGCIYKLDHESALVPNVYRSFFVNQNPDFYAQFFAGGNLNQQLIQIISSSARMDGLLNISKGDFFRVKVPVPIIQEQEKIGTFLVKVDDKIDYVKKELEVNREFKKGLLQLMFY